MYINELYPATKLMGVNLNQHSRRLVRHNKAEQKISATSAVFNFIFMFMETSSIHGFNHLTARRRTVWEYILWLALLILGVVSTAAVGLSMWERYQDKANVIAMERDSQEWTTLFPAATVCPDWKYADEAVQEFVDRLGNSTNRGEMTEFLKRVANATYETLENFTDFPEDIIAPKDYQNVTIQNGLEFKYKMWTSISEDLLTLVRHRNEWGLCYTSNSDVVAYNDPDVWYGRKEKPSPLEKLTGNELDGELFSVIKNMNSPVIAFLHDPMEVPDSASRKLVVPFNSYIAVDFSALSLTASEETRTLSIRQRKCRYPDESNLKLSPVYTYNMCRMECRMMQALKLCGCVPYFYKPIENLNICGPQGMRCLDKYKDSLVRLLEPDGGETRLDCKCLPTCTSVNYAVQLNSDMSWDFETTLKWGLSAYPQMRLKRDVLFGFTDVLVSIGGTAGLFLGCSILSFVEIFYFFTLRLFWYIYHRNKNRP